MLSYQYLTTWCLAIFALSVHMVDGFSVPQKPRTSLNNACSWTVQHMSAVTEVVEDSEKPSDNYNPSPVRRFMFMTPEQDAELKRKGDQEYELMRRNMTPLKAHKVRGVAAASAGGFGGGGAKGKNNKKGGAKKQATDVNVDAQSKSFANEIKRDGIVRIDKVLSPELCDKLKEYLCDLRARATADIENGVISDSQERFADVLRNQNRCDLKIPIGPKPVHDALYHILTKSPVRPLIEYIYNSYGTKGNLATMYELNCFMSNSGSRRQLVHFDTACTDAPGMADDEPIMLTCFVSLQDIDETMGPTAWLLGTHNKEDHAKFLGTNEEENKDGESSKDRLLRTTKAVMGTLPKGSCAVFDPRTLHSAGENYCTDPNMTRALFYFSFKNPKVDYPGTPSTCGYGISTAELTIQELCEELGVAMKKQEGQFTGSRRLDLIASFP